MSTADRDALLARLLRELAPRRFATRWAAQAQPYSSLVSECRSVVTDAGSPAALGAYLQATPIIQESVETLIAYQAMVSNVRWQAVPPLQQPLARRGWHLARWLPTFLLIDAPTGRVLTDTASPLNQLLRSAHQQFPVLTAARDAFNDPFFVAVRNAVAHWSVTWTDTISESYISLHDEGNQTPTKVLLLEAEALHLVAYCVIEALSQHVFDAANPIRDGAKP